MGKPVFSETAFVQRIGDVVAKKMQHPAIPPHRWAEKLARLGQRLLFVVLVVVAVKLIWPWYIVAGCAFLALRALAPELTDSGFKALVNVVKIGKSLKDGTPPAAP